MPEPTLTPRHGESSHHDSTRLKEPFASSNLQASDRVSTRTSFERTKIEHQTFSNLCPSLRGVIAQIWKAFPH